MIIIIEDPSKVFLQDEKLKAKILLQAQRLKGMSTTLKPGETVELQIKSAYFDRSSLQKVIELFQENSCITVLRFINCDFNDSMARRRIAAVSLLEDLGKGLLKSNIEEFTVQEPPMICTCAEATAAFAKYLPMNKQLKILKYDTGTRGSESLCDAVAKNASIQEFSLPRVGDAPDLQPLRRRIAVRLQYAALQKLLQERRKGNLLTAKGKSERIQIIEPVFFSEIKLRFPSLTFNVKNVKEEAAASLSTTPVGSLTINKMERVGGIMVGTCFSE